MSGTGKPWLDDWVEGFLLDPRRGLPGALALTICLNWTTVGDYYGDFLARSESGPWPHLTRVWLTRRNTGV